MKRHSYPHFEVAGLVMVFEHGSSRPDLTVKVSCYVSFQDEAHSALIRDAKWRLERLGMPKDRMDALYFDGGGITECVALNAIGVRRDGNEPIEAFLESTELKKRDVLIRQRRLIPYDQKDMLAIYGPKTTTPQADQVPA